ncbi:hypothetical protein TL16_g04525 [Triparma laevis f. inornata]|uniref:Uncharacterized protein n=1 Tax=Triparma laevis f. inornata TaxID=1714386 RepID=A0A9W7E3K7_9STRA|nr:hypothetical protein TL16_g04525 [Triparma laevis f. inornata]
MNATSRVLTQSTKIDNVIIYDNDDNDYFITDGDDEGDDYGDSRIVDDNLRDLKDHKRSHNKKHSIPEMVRKITASTFEDGEFPDAHTTPVKRRDRPSTKLKGSLKPTPTPTPTPLKFKSKSTGRTYLLPNPDSNDTIRPNAYTSWCFKTGKWLDSRENHYPNPKYLWSPTLESEHIDYLTIVILDDKEIKMIDRALCGRRGEGVTEYEHLTEVCNLEEGFVRAYVELGNKVQGYPVSGYLWSCVVMVVDCLNLKTNEYIDSSLQGRVDCVAVKDLNTKEKTSVEITTGNGVETINKKISKETTENSVVKPINKKRPDETTTSAVIKPTKNKKPEETTLAVNAVDKPSNMVNDTTVDVVVKPTNNKNSVKAVTDAAVKPTNNKKTPQEPKVDAAVKPNKNNKKSEGNVVDDAVKPTNKKKVKRNAVDAVDKATNKKKTKENTVAGGVLPIQKKKKSQGVEKSTNKEKPAEEAIKNACKLKEEACPCNEKEYVENKKKPFCFVPRLALSPLLNKS